MDAYQLQPGDILACYGSDWASWWISFFTASLRRPSSLRLGPSHVGIVVDHPGRGLILVESTTMCDHPCLFRGRPVSGVQAHYPEERIGDYLAGGGHVEVWRMNPYWAVEPPAYWRIVKGYFDNPNETLYDLRGALTSGTRILCKILSYLETDLERLFCSELVAATLMHLCRLPLANATMYNPARLLRQLHRINVYQHVGPVTADFRVVRQEDIS